MGKSAEEKFWEALSRLIERQEQNEKAIERLRERQEKTDEQLRRIQKETHEEFKRIIREMHISDKKLRERVVFPSALETFRKMGFKILEASIRQGVFDDNRKVAEVDNWIEAVFNGKKYIIAGEAKTTCTSDVKPHASPPRHSLYRAMAF